MSEKKKQSVFLISAGMFVIAFITMLLLKSYVYAKPEINTQTGLAELLQLELENEQIAAENEKLRQELSSLQSSQNVSASAMQQLDDARLSAALVEMTGPGVRIILDDSQWTRDGDMLTYYYIHEEYLRQLVNVLWHGGAEAIAINDQRLTSHSEIFCNGAFVQINGTRQSPPYRIVALGNQDDLRTSLQFYFWDKLGHFQQQYGITRELEIPENALSVPAAKPRTYRYAKPVKEGL